MLQAKQFQLVLVAAIALISGAIAALAKPTPIQNPQIHQVKLLARDASQNRQTGRRLDLDRPIGFANLFLTLSNTETVTVTLKIQRIEIQEEQTGKVHLMTPTAQDISLRPLEQGEYALYLSNQMGYPNPNRVKAIVTYQVGEQHQTIESQFVEVQRY
jgi:hypothetical protein